MGWLCGDPKVGARTRAAFDDSDSTMILPAIALAEALWILEFRDKDLSREAFIAAIEGDARIQVAPLTKEVVEVAATLGPALEMHDRLIVATAIVARSIGICAVLLTRDRAIREANISETDW